MSFLRFLGESFLACFPFVFPVLVALYFPRWGNVQRVIAFVIGEIFVMLLLILFAWFEPDLGSFTAFMNALKKLNLVLVVVLVGFYFYLRAPREAVMCLQTFSEINDKLSMQVNLKSVKGLFQWRALR